MSNFAPLAVIYAGKPLLTPARQPLSAPNQMVADAIVAEWEALGDTKIQPHLLPMTGYAALTIDLVIPQRAAVTEELLEYGETDLLCYWGEEELAVRQQSQWQPWITWAEKRFGTHYHLGTGIVPVAQPSPNSLKHQAAMAALSPWQLACLAAVVKPATSLILGLAFVHHALNADELFHLSRLEEEYNIEHWGLEEEAEERANNLLRDLQAAERWRDLL
jgi:chaperone required for assembly of F1-ATPase